VDQERSAVDFQWRNRPIHVHYAAHSEWLLLFCAVYKYTYLLTYLPSHLEKGC